MDNLESIEAICPYCGEPVEVSVEGSGAPDERYVEDCPVCCRPWQVVVSREGPDASVVLLRDDD